MAQLAGSGAALTFATLAAVLAAVPLTVPASAVTVAAEAPTPATTHCAASVLGYLWGDGHPRAGRWFFRTTAPDIAAQFGSCVSAIGATAVRSRHDGWVTFTVSGLPLAVNQSGIPPRLQDASPTDVKAFLAGVIEGEGSQAGLVLDDPERSRVTAMVQLLAAVRVRTRVTGSRYWDVFADRADWPIIHTFPFVVWGRVPGGR